MTIKRARKQFEELKNKVLADGKVDFEETKILLDFIEPYVRAKDPIFVEFNVILNNARKDGVITEEESKTLAMVIDNISSFLKFEAIIEGVAIAVGMLIIATSMFYKLFM